MKIPCLLCQSLFCIDTTFWYVAIFYSYSLFLFPVLIVCYLALCEDFNWKSPAPPDGELMSPGRRDDVHSFVFHSTHRPIRRWARRCKDVRACHIVSLFIRENISITWRYFAASPLFGITEVFSITFGRSALTIVNRLWSAELLTTSVSPTIRPPRVLWRGNAAAAFVNYSSSADRNAIKYRRKVQLTPGRYEHAAGGPRGSITGVYVENDYS